MKSDVSLLLNSSFSYNSASFCAVRTIRGCSDRYWSLRAEEFSRYRILDLAGPVRMCWHDFFKKELPDCKGKTVRALDCGTGAGFFAFLLAELGCETTGVDYSQSTVDQAEETSAHLHYPPIRFLRMDAQDMPFADNSFDFIVSRNMTWTVPAPEKVYREWARLLAPGGVVINFDANYGYIFRMQDDTGVTEKTTITGSRAAEKASVLTRT